MLDKFNEIIKNEKIMDIIATIFVVLIPFVFFVLWGGFLKNINFNNLFHWRDVGVFTFIYTYAVLTIRVKLRRTGKINAVSTNKELDTLVKNIQATTFHRSEYKLGFQFIKQLNITKKENANKEFTQKKIDKLENDIQNLIARGKPYDHIEQQIKQLEKTPLIDTKFTPYKFKDLINTNVLHQLGNKKEDGRSINHNVEWAGFKGASIRELLKGVAYGSAAIGFAWSLPGDVTVAYLLLLIFGIVMTSVTSVIFSVLDTNGKFFNAMKMKYDLMLECREYIDNTRLEQSKQENEQVIEKEETIAHNENESVSEAFEVNALDLIR